MKKTHKLTSENKEDIVKLRGSGLTLAQIARQFNIDRSAVHYVLKNARYREAVNVQILFRDKHACQICLNPGRNVSSLGSTLPNKGGRALCFKCLDNINKLIKLGYLNDKS